MYKIDHDKNKIVL